MGRWCFRRRPARSRVERVPSSSLHLCLCRIRNRRVVRLSDGTRGMFRVVLDLIHHEDPDSYFRGLDRADRGDPAITSDVPVLRAIRQEVFLLATDNQNCGESDIRHKVTDLLLGCLMLAPIYLALEVVREPPCVNIEGHEAVR